MPHPYHQEVMDEEEGAIMRLFSTSLDNDTEGGEGMKLVFSLERQKGPRPKPCGMPVIIEERKGEVNGSIMSLILKIRNEEGKADHIML